jgi:translation initiation factor 2 subunit 2
MYTDIELLDRAYEILGNTVTEKEKPKGLDCRVSFKNKKTYLFNFVGICEKLNRDSAIVEQYFDTELSCVTSVDNKGSLIFIGKYTEVKIKLCLTSYIKTFVECRQCGSKTTQYLKENKINYIDCKTCLSKIAI